MVKAIFFDLGGVLVTDVFTVLDPFFSRKAHTLAEKVKDIRKTYWLDYELGRMTGHEFMQKVLADLGFGLEPERAMQIACAMIKLDKDVFKVMKKLKESGKYRIGVISNNSKEWSVYSKENLGIGAYCDSWIVSCDLGIKKPDKEIYLKAAESLGLMPEECLFIDNKQRNIDGAAVVGMKGIHFKDAKQLVEELKKLGIET
jgi:putative hydrolase of the HAD superfamily